MYQGYYPVFKLNMENSFMPHPLVDQLRFTRSEFMRAVKGISDEDAHIIPRYMDEPEKYHRNQPWSYPKEHMISTPANLERDRDLMEEIANAIKVRQH
jgi:hypothetical protein